MKTKTQSTTAYLSLTSLTILILLLMISVFVHSFMSRILGITMVCIVDPEFEKSNISSGSNHTVDPIVDNPCHADNRRLNSSNEDLGYHGTIQWTKQEQSNIYAMHNWARLAFLSFSGFIIRLFNSTQVYAAATVACAIITAFFPLAVKTGGYAGTVAGRFALGAGHAFSSPCLDQVVADYVPQHIKSTAYSIITSGSQIAVFVGSPLAAYFCSRPDFWGGWSATFYVGAIVAGIWLVLFEAFMVYVLYIKKSNNLTYTVQRINAKTAAGGKPGKNKPGLKEMAVGFWENIVKERAVYGLLPCDVAATWTIGLFTNFLPKYYRDVLRLPLEANGLFSALPFVIQMISKIVFSMAADGIKAYTRMTPSLTSKLFNVVGLVGSGFCVLITACICMPASVAISLVCIGYGLYSCCTPGFRTSLVSINPEWTAVISVVCTVAAMVAGIVFPYMQGAIVQTGTVREWKTLFGIMFAIDCFAAFMYFTFGSLEGKQEREEMAEKKREERNS